MIARRTIRLYGHREHTYHRGYWPRGDRRGRCDVGQRWYCRIRIVRVKV